MNKLMRITKRLPTHQRGLSLIELMIATVLGLIIVAALTQLFADVTRANREMAKTNSQIENARYAMQLLRNDIVHGGYWGAHVPEFDDIMYSEVPADVPTLIPDPCLPNASWTAAYEEALVGIPIQSYTGSPSGTCNTILSGELTANGTDVLVVRHADTCAAGTTNCAADVTGTNAPLYVQVSNFLTQLEAPGPYYAMGAPYDKLNRVGVAAEKRLFVQNIYFIKDNANGIPSLYRSEFGVSSGVPAQLAAQEIVPGVERFRVELGIDSLSETGDAIDYTVEVDWQDPDDWKIPTNRGDGIPDGAFVHCTAAGTSPCALADLINVATVKIYILARADEPSPGYTDTKTYQLGTLSVPAFGDNFKRHVFSSTIRLNNISGRRETP